MIACRNLIYFFRILSWQKYNENIIVLTNVIEVV